MSYDPLNGHEQRRAQEEYWHSKDETEIEDHVGDAKRPAPCVPGDARRGCSGEDHGVLAQPGKVDDEEHPRQRGGAQEQAFRREQARVKQGMPPFLAHCGFILLTFSHAGPSTMA